MKPIATSVIVLALVTSWTPSNLWAQRSEAEMLQRARVTKHQAKKIALATIKNGTIKCVQLQKGNGVLIWSVDIAQPPKKDLTDVWVDAKTARITSVEIETPIIEKKEMMEKKAQKWLSPYESH